MRLSRDPPLLKEKGNGEICEEIGRFAEHPIPSLTLPLKGREYAKARHGTTVGSA
jgi:hypothetical protein